MGEEKGPDFYTGKGYMKDGAFEKNLPIYEAAVNLLPSPSWCPLVIDIGCGIGYFAKVLEEKKYEKYLGVDFSNKVINIAKIQTINDDYKYICRNILSDDCDFIFQQTGVIFTLLETLEHIEDDLSVIKKIQPNNKIIISVPNRDFISHVRHFKKISDVIDRYDSLIKFDKFSEINTNPNKNAKVFILKGIRRCEKRG